MKLRYFLALSVLIVSTPALGRIIAGVVVGPGSYIGSVRTIPDANALDPGHATGKAVALSSVKNLLRPDWAKFSKGVKLYKFTAFPEPLSNFVLLDRSLLSRCSPNPARFISNDPATSIEYYLVVLDCPTESNPKKQLAAAVKEENQKTVSIVINADTVPVVDGNG